MISQLRSTPNLLTLLRLVFIPFAVIAVLGHRYNWALGIFLVAGISDGLDGLLARLLKQKTELGQYLDPIADKLLLSTMFLVLSLQHNIPWSVTVLVFSRDIIILIICSLLYATGTLREFSPSWFGKANTLAQIITVPVVMLHEIFPGIREIGLLRQFGFNVTIAMTVISGVHYLWKVGLALRATGNKSNAGQSS
ncbi:MAG TPA: CDP-alcohol phosphatidyltransferase family protein [Alphaproteobacteria bacterium]|nr:CDP-alcohol phosphatidyltransferase family protein [Alphaproteobacteria bacterium]